MHFLHFRNVFLILQSFKKKQKKTQKINFIRQAPMPDLSSAAKGNYVPV